MPTHVSHREDLFPAGTSVSVYTDRGHGPPTSGAPSGTAITGSPFTVAGDGSLTITGLETAGKYLLYASSPDRYLRIFVPGPPTFKDMDLDGIEDGDAIGYDAGTNKITSLGPVVSESVAGIQAHAPTSIAATDTAMLTEFFGDVPANGRGLLRNDNGGIYALDGPLVINKSIVLNGLGPMPQFPAKADDAAANGEFPLDEFAGPVFLQTQAGANGIELPKSGATVHLSGFAIKFDDAIAMTDTGHGIYSYPDKTYTSRPDFGLMSSVLSDISVFGHDGDHYGFDFTNINMSTLTNLRSYGGGGIRVTGNSAWYNHGNLVFIHPYVKVRVGGAAHGYDLRSDPISGRLNLITFIRPQVNISSGSPGGGLPAPTTAQYLFRASDPTSIGPGLTIIAPDFESSLDCPIDFGSNPRKFIDPSGFYGALTSNSSFDVMVDPQGGLALKSDMQPRGTRSGTTVAAGSGSGAGATVSVSGDEFGGIITLNTGTSPNGGSGQVAFTLTLPTFQRIWGMHIGPQNLAAVGAGTLVPIMGGSSPNSTVSFRYTGTTPPASTSGLSFIYKGIPR